MAETEKQYREGWYFFGKCTPYPVQVKVGRIPRPPYKKFATKEECQKFINELYEK